MQKKIIIKKISLIIPSKNDFFLLVKILDDMKNWSNLPGEIIIVDSSNNKISLKKDFLYFCKKKGISTSIIYKKNSFPGKSRNIGVEKSKFRIIAFLDSKTFPNKNWLKLGLDFLIKSKVMICWGTTKYISTSQTSEDIIVATYGKKPIQTLPGSIMYKKIFDITGKFVETVRAGEDGDWKSRVYVHKINARENSSFLNYYIDNNFNYLDLFKKWIRNYSHTSRLPFFRPHKELYFYFLFILFLIFLSWNPYFVRSFEFNNLFIPHLAKTSSFATIIFYIVFRSIILPFKKGVSFYSLFPIKFIKIFFISLLVDIAKIIAFIKARIIKK